MAENTSVCILRDLIHISNRISYISSTYKSIIKRQCLDLTRRITFLTPLFQELLHDVVSINTVPYDALVSLQQALLAAGQLLHFCSHGSQLYMIMEREKVKCRFKNLASDFEQAITKVSCEKLDISEELKEQVALVTAQFKKAKEHFEPPGLELYKHLSSVYNQSCDMNDEPAELRVICKKLQFVNVEDIKQESLALQKMVVDENGGFEKSMEGMSIVLAKIEDFMLKDSANIVPLSSGDSPLQTDEPCVDVCSQSLVIPEEFRCPISLEIMKDPVIITTGQTYERACIKKWLDAGHGTCPKTQQILSSSILIPNHVLYSLISNWCEENGVEPPKRTANIRLCKATSDGSSELIDLNMLIRKLTSSDIEDQRCAAGELRLLAKNNGQNRLLIAEAGAVPLLVDLLYVSDARTQEQTVTALLNLSIHDYNKELIMASEALPGILHVLKTGSMQARENAAATFFSLSAVAENKVAIGASGAIEALVTLFCEGSQRGKVDAGTALFSLCVYHGNKGRAIRAGIVPKLIEMLTEPGGAMRDEALAIMALIVSHPDGKAAIGSINAVPTLVGLIRNGSARGKENATSVLVHLCSGDRHHLSSVSSLGVIDHLLDMVENGSERSKRKASQLLDLMGISRPL